MCHRMATAVVAMKEAGLDQSWETNPGVRVHRYMRHTRDVVEELLRVLHSELLQYCLKLDCETGHVVSRMVTYQLETKRDKQVQRKM